MMPTQPKISPLPQVGLRARRHRLYNPRPFFISIALLSLLGIWSLVAQTFSQHQSIVPENALGKRTVYQVEGLNSSNVFAPFEQEIECRLVRQADDQCSFVKANCLDENGIFSYLQLYYCSLHHVQPLAFIIIIVWLSILFSTIGIAASDFLCINLSTIASLLGMSESLTGVTFLAFGNGSPDVFSTFAAMGSNSGGLAIGELIGAACFITTVVAGSMALARPFRVARRSFVRDVGFFIIAATFSLIVLANGELRIWQCIVMIGLYVFYVLLVVFWHWYLGRQRCKHEREIAARAQFHIPQSQELDLQEQPFDDDPVAGESTRLLGQRSPDFEALERLNQPMWEDEEEDEETRNRNLAEIHENMRVTHPSPFSRRSTISSIRPSLVGALEFQSVLSSLKKAKNIHDGTFDLRQYSENDPTGQAPRRPIQSRATLQHPEDLSRSPSMKHGLGLSGAFNNAKTYDETRRRLDRDRPNTISLQHGTQVQPLQSDQTTLSTLSNSSLRLTVPENPFHSPNYQVSPRSRQPSRSPSPSGLSPLTNGRVLPVSANFEEENDNETIDFPPFVESPSSISPSPSSLDLRLTSISPNPRQQNTVPEENHHFLHLSKGKLYHFLTPGTLFFTLFPTLCDWNAKTYWGKILSVIAVPSVFCLTITVPVMDPARSDNTDNPPDLPPSSYPPPVVIHDEDAQQPAPIIRLPDESPTLQPQDHQALSYGLRQSIEHLSPVGKPKDLQTPPNRLRMDSELPAAHEPTDGTSPTTTRIWHRGLTTIQIFTSPLFVIVAGWSFLDDGHKARNLIIPVLASLGVSLVCAISLNILLRKHNYVTQVPDKLRPFLSFVGFTVGICWIAAIADEVVSLLRTLGVILNISDSLLGLTVFAVGNSLSDLVADITVARLGYPVMALSACFGGPMLNILLGIGIGGLYMTLHSNVDITTQIAPHHIPYKTAFSRTLIISGATLLVTLVGLLIIVPLNHWKMDRKIGCGLIVLWCLSTLGNVIVEIVT